MGLDTTELKGVNEQIHLKFKGHNYTPNDDGSLMTIISEVNDDEELLDVTDPNYLVIIKRIYGSINIGDIESGLSLHIELDTSKLNWKISCSPIKRVNDMIFPHEIEIDLDNSEILIRFDVYF